VGSSSLHSNSSHLSQFKGKLNNKTPSVTVNFFMFFGSLSALCVVRKNGNLLCCIYLPVCSFILPVFATSLSSLFG
jgi:hypothetical protein